MLNTIATHAFKRLPWTFMWIVCFLNINAAYAQSQKEQTQLILKVEASPQTNPSETGIASPIKVRIYELKDGNTFSESDYFSLEKNDKSVLGSDMLARDEFILRPSEQRKIERKSNPQTVVLGVLASYRDLNSVWRVVQLLPEAPEAAWYRAVMPTKKIELNIQLQPQGIVVVPVP